MGFFLSGDYGMLIEIITEYTWRYFLDILEPSIFDGDFLGVTSQDGENPGPKWRSINRWDDQQLPGAMIVEGHVPRGGLRNSG